MDRSTQTGRPLAFLALPLVTLALACGTAEAGPDALPRCEEFEGGARITFEIVDERLVVWSTADAFIDEAQRLLTEQEQRVPNFLELREGTLCDPQWSWHPAPEAMDWADVTIELCDGTPALVEADLSYWLEMVGQFCPWDARVVEVDDRRQGAIR